MSYTTENIRNVAFAGHPGAGKTMLFEALLHAGGAIQTAGTIERGTTVSDFDPIEKERGHSVDAAIASIDALTDNAPIHINLVDTPGYPGVSTRLMWMGALSVNASMLAIAASTECPRSFSIGSKSETVVPRSMVPAVWIAPPACSRASKSMVLPAPGWPAKATLRMFSVV